MFRLIPLLNTLNEIDGWLEPVEADLLVNAAIRACAMPGATGELVEVGSYHGKSTVALGSMLRSFFPDKKVYAIDPHRGELWPKGQGPEGSPSLGMFRYNISRLGLEAYVEPIVAHSYEVKWDQPIAFLFVDGLHDYENVSRDFRHFEPYLEKKALVAFHDYIDAFPGVQQFVNELLAGGLYEKADLAHSLMVLQKK